MAQDAKTNIIFLNIGGEFEEHLYANEDFIRARNPMIVAPREYADRLSEALIEDFNIKFISSFSDRHFIRDLPGRLQELLQQHLASHAGRVQTGVAENIPVHIVSLGSNIVSCDQITKHDNRNSYRHALDYDDLREALAKTEKTNVLFLNMHPDAFAEHLDNNQPFINVGKPLIVAANDDRQNLSPALVAKYDIKFVPWLFTPDDVPNFLEALQKHLQQRARDGRS